MDLPADKLNRRVAISCDLVAAYLRHNAVPTADVADLIVSVYGMVEALRTGEVTVRDLTEPPPVRATRRQIRASITHDALISFEDGQPYKTLKRHLAVLGLTPDAYRAKWGLPSDYPMVCRGYSEHRSDLARANGLGRPGAVALSEAAE